MILRRVGKTVYNKVIFIPPPPRPLPYPPFPTTVMGRGRITSLVKILVKTAIHQTKYIYSTSIVIHQIAIFILINNNNKQIAKQTNKQQHNDKQKNSE